MLLKVNRRSDRNQSLNWIQSFDQNIEETYPKSWKILTGNLWKMKETEKQLPTMLNIVYKTSEIKFYYL